MPLQFVRNDITRMHVDAIVNAANTSLLGGGGVDGAIHRAAGPGLLEECRTLNGCRTGEAKLTGGYQLPCRYVIHTVGPVYEDGKHNEKELLQSCYRNSLELAVFHKCESVAFPLISAGVYGYPKQEAFSDAVEAITEFLTDHEITVYLVIFDRDSFAVSEDLRLSVESYIDDHYAETHLDMRAENRRPVPHGLGAAFFSEKMHAVFHSSEDAALQPAEEAALKPVENKAFRPVKKKKSLQEAVNALDESFSEMLLRKIDEKGMKDSDCYKKANIDRKLFSKIRSDSHYRPSKPTVLAFAVALELPLEETREMLMKAGFALSPSSKFDVIVQYFIENREYNIYKINEALFLYDQMMLGA